MWFQRLRLKRRQRKALEKAIPDTPCHETLRDFVPLLDPSWTRVYKPMVGLNIRMEVVYPNVTQFMGALDKALRTVRDMETVSSKDRKQRRVEDGLHVILLDDFLINDERHPVAYTEVVEGIRQRLIMLDNVFKIAKQEDTFQYKYYLRQYTHLMRETHVVLRGLIEAT